MHLDRKIIFSVIFVFFLLHLAISQESAMISFKLKDQFNNSYTEKDFMNHVVIIVGSDKEGSQYNERWSLAIYDSLIKKNLVDSVRFLPVADLRGIPFFVKSLVRSKFPKEKYRWILLDWQGRFAEAYNFTPNASNIIILDKDFKVNYRTFAYEIEKEKLQAIWLKLVSLLE